MNESRHDEIPDYLGGRPKIKLINSELTEGSAVPDTAELDVSVRFRFGRGDSSGGVCTRVPQIMKTVFFRNEKKQIIFWIESNTAPFIVETYRNPAKQLKIPETLKMGSDLLRLICYPDFRIFVSAKIGNRDETRTNSFCASSDCASPAAEP